MLMPSVQLFSLSNLLNSNPAHQPSRDDYNGKKHCLALLLYLFAIILQLIRQAIFPAIYHSQHFSTMPVANYTQIIHPQLNIQPHLGFLQAGSTQAIPLLSMNSLR